MSELRKLAEFSSSVNIKCVPDEVIDATRSCVLDSVGAAIGAAFYEEIPTIIKNITTWSGENKKKSAWVWGHNLRLPILDASLLIGIMGHALELDDVHTLSKLHPGAVVVPTAWVLAEAMGVSGAEFIQAVISGYEVMSRVGEGFGVTSHRKRGWHVTGTAGTFGAAAAAARLFNLDAKQTLDSFGIAGTQSSGLWAFLEDGASSKKLHPARAIVNGITAAILVDSGMTGPEHILDAKDGGLYRATSDSFDMNLVSKELGTRYEIMYIDKKLYPCCRSTHPPIDAALKIRRNENIDVNEIDSIVIETFDVGVMQCGSPIYPKSAVEAKFSTPYVVAVALLNNKVTLEQFNDDSLNNEKIKRLALKVKVCSTDEFTNRYPKRWSCKMIITLKDGSVLTEVIDDMSGSVNSPLTYNQEKEKFFNLVKPILGEKRTDTIISEILNIDRVKALPCLGK